MAHTAMALESLATVNPRFVQVGGFVLGFVIKKCINIRMQCPRIKKQPLQLVRYWSTKNFRIFVSLHTWRGKRKEIFPQDEGARVPSVYIKVYSIQRAEYALKSSREVKTSDDPLDFLKNDEVKTEIEEILMRVSKSEIISSKQYSLILAFLAASLIYSNAQRPAIV